MEPHRNTRSTSMEMHTAEHIVVFSSSLIEPSGVAYIFFIAIISRALFYPVSPFES